MIQQVVLVNEMDIETGVMEKMEAHEKGLLHRAFSVFIFNRTGEMLIQQRALHKYHSAGLWSNACCSHPGPGQEITSAALSRLREEMGFETPVQKIYDFVYKASFENGLTEHEFDHVFVGEYDGPVPFNPNEVMDCAYLPMEKIRESLNNSPHEFTAWFRIVFPQIMNWWKIKYPGRQEH